MHLLFIGTTELILIAAIALLLFGGKKLPELMKGLGKGVSSFKQGMKNGRGVEEAADGTRFEGNYQNDVRHGAFVEKDRNGKVIRKGSYNRGRQE